MGLWIAAGLLSNSISYGEQGSAIVIAGLLLALINMVIKANFGAVFFAALLVTLGLFMVVINGATVYLANKLYGPLHITNFWAAMFAGLMIGLVNYLVSAILERNGEKA